MKNLISINVEDGHHISEAITSSDIGNPMPIWNFKAIKIPTFVTIDSNSYPSKAYSIRREDYPEIELGVSSASEKEGYTILQNMELVNSLFSATDELPNKINIWNTKNGQTCGIESFLKTTIIDNEEWECFNVLRHSHDLSMALETTCVLVRSSDQLRYPLVFDNGIIRYKHTVSAIKKSAELAKGRRQVGEALIQQIEMLSALANIPFSFNRFKQILFDSLPKYDPEQADSEKAVSRRSTVIAEMQNYFNESNTITTCLISFMKYLANDSSIRSSAIHDEKEVRFAAINFGSKFNELKTVQTAIKNALEKKGIE